MFLGVTKVPKPKKVKAELMKNKDTSSLCFLKKQNFTFPSKIAIINFASVDENLLKMSTGKYINSEISKPIIQIFIIRQNK